MLKASATSINKDILFYFLLIWYSWKIHHNFVSVWNKKFNKLILNIQYTIKYMYVKHLWQKWFIHFVSCRNYLCLHKLHLLDTQQLFNWFENKWASSCDYGTYHIGDQQRLRRDCMDAFAVRTHEVWKQTKVWPKIRDLALSDGLACTFEEWVYGGQKVP